MVEEATAVLNYENAPDLPIHRKIIAGSFFGEIADGYILGIVGIAMSYATKSLNLTSFWLGLITAASMIGILFGSSLAGYIADRIGRKKVFSYVMGFMFILAASPYFISDPLTLTVVRFALGMCIGADYTIAISMLSEWVPGNHFVAPDSVFCCNSRCHCFLFAIGDARISCVAG
jgi:putative MFS transporter